MHSKLLIVIALIAITFQSLIAQPAGKGYQLLFEDNFNGNLVNESDWSYRLDSKRKGVNLKENVSVGDGFLHISVRQDPIDGIIENTGGGLISKRLFGFGYYETLSKPFMAGTGVHSSFWQAGGLDNGVENRIFEIDSYEIDSKTPIGCNNLYIHLSSLSSPRRSLIPLSFMKDGWLLDAYEYTPSGVIYYDNGKIIGEVKWDNLVGAQKVWLTALNGYEQVEKDKQPGETLFDYFRYYAKEYPGVNILPNGSFEYYHRRSDPSQPVAWYNNSSGSSSKVISGDASTGNKFLRHGLTNEAFFAETWQELEYIVNAEYTLSAMVRCSGGLDKADITVYGFGGEIIKYVIPVSAGWKKIEIRNIPVSNNNIGIRISTKGDAGSWVEIDDLQLMIPSEDEQKQVQEHEYKLLDLNPDPVWHFAKKNSCVFSGVEKYLFDFSQSQTEQFGNAITVSFRVKPNLKANMIPIFRMPKNGKSGWAVMLLEDGGVNFGIGSQETNFCLHAPNVYRAGEECLITCILNKGVATIAVNGKVITTKTGIEYGVDVDDPRSVGWLGNHPKLEAQFISKVFNFKEESKPPLLSDNLIHQKFKGAIRDVRIYNRAISEKEMHGISKYLLENTK